MPQMSPTPISPRRRSLSSPSSLDQFPRRVHRSPRRNERQAQKKSYRVPNPRPGEHLRCFFDVPGAECSQSEQAPHLVTGESRAVHTSASSLRNDLSISIRPARRRNSSRLHGSIGLQTLRLSSETYATVMQCVPNSLLLRFFLPLPPVPPRPPRSLREEGVSGFMSHTESR